MYSEDTNCLKDVFGFSDPATGFERLYWINRLKLENR